MLSSIMNFCLSCIYGTDNDHVCSVEYTDARENKLDDHEEGRPELASAFFEGVYISLNTTCLIIVYPS